MKERVNEAVWLEKYQRWQINVQNDGERRSFYSTTPGKKGKAEAERKCEKWLKEGTVKDVRFGVLWKDFMEEVKATTGTANYNKHEQMGRLWLLPNLQHKKVSRITDQEYQDCLNDGFKNDLYEKSIKNIRASITAVCRYAKKNKIAINKPEDLTIPKGAKKMERKILQPGGLKTLFTVDYITHYNKQVKSHYIHLWRFIVLSGLRPGEAEGLQKADIRDGIAHINRSINCENEITGGKNDNAKRYWVLSALEIQLLAEQDAMLKAKGIISPWIFPDECGEMSKPRSIYKQWYTFRKQHDLDSSLYELRHTFISIVKNTMPKSLLKRKVGHSEAMDTYGVYGHEVEGELQQAAAIVDSVFSKLVK